MSDSPPPAPASSPAPHSKDRKRTPIALTSLIVVVVVAVVVVAGVVFAAINRSADDASGGDRPAPSQTAAKAGTRENPYPLGTTVTANGWEITVNSVTFDADAAVLAAHPLNDAPAPGSEYILVDVTITAVLTRQDVFFPGFVTFDYVTREGEAVVDVFAVAPDTIDLTTPIGLGDSVEGNIAMEVPAAGAEEGLIAVQSRAPDGSAPSVTLYVAVQ